MQTKPKFDKIIEINEDMAEENVPEFYREYLCYKAFESDKIYTAINHWQQTKDYEIIKELMEGVRV